ncbi:MAG TPA: triose-phosphate isomerase [Flavobacteriales bacterium]|nr:triose-phosphate isomerase [Flavobacteriales bacterium]HRE97476.1 triose-phosphate isomerase [Flavobacteriales bacterium]HRJ37911.1 triose-phosphate isomerase [Flavobacteriales bacterium]
MMKRKKIVAGNWKMNHSYHEALAVFAQLLEHKEEFPANAEVIICPPALYLREFAKKAGNHVALGAQNCHFEVEGAFTGEISAEMIKSVGARYCILGHSERRSMFAETDEIVSRKLRHALTVSLNVILCCGESLEVREDDNHFAWVQQQLNIALDGLSPEQMQKVVIAYEPVWAIGTGLTASRDQAQEMHAFIRRYIAERFNEETANTTRILYGGSCNAENAPLLFSCPDVDGGLIGGASLKLSTFLPIILAAR